MMPRRAICWTLLLCLLAVPVWAADDNEDAAEEATPEPAPVFTPGEIVVTGRRTPAEMTSSRQEITADDIRALGARNVAEALALATGMRVDSAPNALSANGKQEFLASLRGFDPRNVIILIDGIPVYEPYFRVLDLRQIPVGDIAKIKIIKGPTSVLYGPNALGGVINIITKRGGGPATGHVDASYGDIESYAGNASVRGGADGWEYFLAPGFAKSAGLRLPSEFTATRNEDGALRENSDYVDYYLSGKAGYYAGANGISLSANHYEFDGGVPFSMEAVEPSTLWRKFWRKSGVALHGELAPTDFFYLRGKAFYTRFFNTITTYTDTSLSAIGADGDAISTYDNDIFGYQLLPEFLLGRAGTITLSLLYKQDRIDIQDETGGPWYDFGGETYSGAAEYGLAFFDFNFTTGAAYHFFRRTQTPTDDLGEDDAAVDYQAALGYSPHEAIELFVGAAHKTAFADLKSLYGSQGNPELDAESANNIDAGFRAQPLPELGFASTWFHSAITDLIGKEETGNEFTYENISKARITGLESRIDLNLFAKLWTTTLAHTYLDTRDQRPTRRLERLDFRPEHSAYVDTRLNAPFGTQFAVQYFYVGERQYEEPGKDRKKKALPEYGTLNARVAHRITWDGARTSAEFFVEGKNVLDVYYEQAPEKPAAGRMLTGGVAVDF